MLPQLTDLNLSAALQLQLCSNQRPLPVYKSLVQHTQNEISHYNIGTLGREVFLLLVVWPWLQDEDI